MPHHPDRSPAQHPYEQLTPDLVLDALASVGLVGDGRLTALSSYENRVYQVALDEPWDGLKEVVVKFYRPERWSEAQILEEHAFALELMDAEIPVIGPLVMGGQTLHHFGTHDARFAFAVSPRRGGRPPELEDMDVLEWIGRFLGRIHAVGARQPFGQRPALDLHSFGAEPRDWLLANQAVPLDVQALWQARGETALDLIAKKCHGALTHSHFDSKIRRIRLHGDCHPGNILWTPADAQSPPGRPKATAAPSGGSEPYSVGKRGGEHLPGPHFVDMDDARTGPAVQDLWMLLSGDRRQRTLQLSALLDGYEQFREFDREELALIEPLRTLRLIHYSAWLARRWADPIFPINFPWFGTSDYWHGQVHMLEEQIEAMEEDPLMV